MSRKHVVNDYEMFTATKYQTGQANPSVPATASQTSGITNVLNLDNATIHVLFSAPNSGTLIVEARNISPLQGDVSGFYPLNFGAPLTITSETNVQIILNSMAFTDLRIKWVPSSGSGTVSAFLNMKTVGA